MGFGFEEISQEAEEITANTVDRIRNYTCSLTADEMRPLMDKSVEVMLAVASGGADGSAHVYNLVGLLDGVFRKLVDLEIELKTLESVDNSAQ